MFRKHSKSTRTARVNQQEEESSYEVIADPLYEEIPHFSNDLDKYTICEAYEVIKSSGSKSQLAECDDVSDVNTPHGEHEYSINECPAYGMTKLR